MRRTKSYRSQEMDEFERKAMTITVNGKQTTVGEAHAMKVAMACKQRRERKASVNKFIQEKILPKLMKKIERTKKSTRCLKTIRAFVDNGPIQWSHDYKLMKKMYPELNSSLNRYRTQYERIAELVQELEKNIKKNKFTKKFFNMIQEFGSQMFNLLDMVEQLAYSINKSHICDAPCFANQEIIIGASDGKRKGLQQILSSTFSNLNTTKTNLIDLARYINTVYEDIDNFKIKLAS